VPQFKSKSNVVVDVVVVEVRDVTVVVVVDVLQVS